MSNIIDKTNEARGERKYWNYADNWNRLTNAMENKEYVGAISLCSALIEDRLLSILKTTMASYEKYYTDVPLGVKLKELKRVTKINEILSKHLNYDFCIELDIWVKKEI